ncbi:MAG: hypothetical protein LBI38_07055 [Oscillospiraceae bacterium]|nr:hypothetical protein [Oscillospiraceae bacterium]
MTGLKIKTPLNIANAYLRYDLDGIFALSEKGVDFFEPRLDGAELFETFLIGLTRYLDETGFTPPERRAVAEEMYSACLPGYVEERVLTAKLAALPQPSVIAGEKKPLIALDLYTWYCDVMGRSEEELLKSTPREALERFESYARFKGWIKPPLQIKEFDD